MELGKVNSGDIQRQVKANQFEGYQKALEQERAQHQTRQSVTHSGIKWNIIKSKDEPTRVNPLMETDYVNVSSVRKMDTTVSAAIVSHKLGYKISFEERKEILMDKYIKNFIQSKSHNYIIAKFAQLKSAFLSQLLSNIGVTIPELQKMQKKALDGAQDENELLFEENEYNAEMICVIGGSGKKLKKELKIMDEIREQLMTQMANLGKGDYYNEEHLINTKIKVCKRIRDEFMKEKDLMEYERDYRFINKEAVKTKPRSIFSS